jgi:hypothetical protein
MDEIQIRQGYDSDHFELAFKFHFNYEKWKASFSFEEYVREFRHLVAGMYSSEVT